MLVERERKHAKFRFVGVGIIRRWFRDSKQFNAVQFGKAFFYSFSVFRKKSEKLLQMADNLLSVRFKQIFIIDIFLDAFMI